MKTFCLVLPCTAANDYLAELLDVLFVDMLNDADASWERLSLLDIASYKNGLAMQKFRPAPGDPGLPVLKIKELGQGVCTPDSERCASTIDESVKIHDGNLVFSWSGTLLLDFWAGDDAGLNQHLFKVTSDRYPSWLYYLWTKHHMDRFIMLAKDRATTMGHIKRSALAESEVLIPPVEQLEVLTRRIQPIVDELVVNKIQSRNLAGLRDVLLPKLMSGEIDVSNVRLSMPPNNHLSCIGLRLLTRERTQKLITTFEIEAIVYVPDTQSPLLLLFHLISSNTLSWPPDTNQRQDSSCALISFVVILNVEMDKFIEIKQLNRIN